VPSPPSRSTTTRPFSSTLKLRLVIPLESGVIAAPSAAPPRSFPRTRTARRSAGSEAPLIDESQVLLGHGERVQLMAGSSNASRESAGMSSRRSPSAGRVSVRPTRRLKAAMAPGRFSGLARSPSGKRRAARCQRPRSSGPSSRRAPSPGSRGPEAGGGRWSTRGACRSGWTGDGPASGRPQAFLERSRAHGRRQEHLPRASRSLPSSTARGRLAITISSSRGRWRRRWGGSPSRSKPPGRG